MRIIDGSADVCSSDHVILNTRNTSARRQEANFVMDGKKIALLAGALIIAIATAFMARSMFASSGAPQATAANMQPQLDGPQVLVATRALPVGTIIGPDSFRFQPGPKDLRSEENKVGKEG